MSYRCDHFDIRELVGPDVFAKRGMLAWDLMDAELLRTLDQLRKRYGVITINNWADGGTFKESGLRDPLTTTGAVWSMHKFGRAADLKFKDVSAMDVQEDVLAHPDLFPLLTCMENAEATKTWLHVDTRNHSQQQQIWIVNP